MVDRGMRPDFSEKNLFKLDKVQDYFNCTEEYE